MIELMTVPTMRKSYKQAFLKPQYMTIEELEELDM